MKSHFGKSVTSTILVGVIAIVLGVCFFPRVDQSAVEIKDTVVPAAIKVTDSPAEQEDSGDAEVKGAATNETVLQEYEVEVPEDDSAFIPNQETSEAEKADAETFVMPTGMSYEPNVALFMVEPGSSPEEVSEAISSAEGIVAHEVTSEEIESGLIRVEVEAGTSVEDAVNELQSQDVVSAAQPNYVYLAEDLVAGDPAPEPEANSAEEGNGQNEGDQAVIEDVPSPTEGENESDLLGEDAKDETAQPAEEATVDAAPAITEVEVQDQEDGAIQEEAEAESAMEEGAEVAGLVAEATANDYSATKQWGIQDIDAPAAWDKLGKRSSNHAVTVAVMDMGFQTGHEDLAGKLVSPYNAYTGGTSVLPVDGSGSINYNHGTHIAGVIAANTNNGKGVASTTYNYVKVMPIMIAGKNASGSTVVTSQSFQTAFNHVLNDTTNNIRVINLSVGGTDSEIEKWLTSSITRAYNKGIVTVASAGNEGASKGAYAHYPSDIDQCVAVMALTQSRTRASLSNYNRNSSDHKDISAPGMGIYSTFNSGYGTLNGTSMATPFVSSVVAMEFVANYSLSSEQAVNILYGTSRDLGAKGWDLTTGYGEVNAAAAVQAAIDGNMSDAQESRLDEQESAREKDQAAEQERQRAAEEERQRQEAAAQQQRDNAAYNSITYQVHGQTYGWQDWVSAGATAGTTGQAKRVEALQVALSGAPYAGGVTYRVHGQSYGWQGWVADGQMAGTTGQSRRVEAIQIALTGEMAERYDVWYRTHCQSLGWMGWACNGACSGSATFAKRVEALEVVVLPKGSAAPGDTSRPFATRQVGVNAHCQSLGWTGWAYDGETAGTTGQSKRMEALCVSLGGLPCAGGVRYRAHCQTYGWRDWVADGAVAGTTGQSKRVEALQVELYGEAAELYDVWYRAHAAGIGWMGWAANGAVAGTTGQARRLEAVQVVLLPKGSAAPGDTWGAQR